MEKLEVGLYSEFTYQYSAPGIDLLLLHVPTSFLSDLIRMRVAASSNTKYEESTKNEHHKAEN